MHSESYKLILISYNTELSLLISLIILKMNIASSKKKKILNSELTKQFIRSIIFE